MSIDLPCPELLSKYKKGEDFWGAAITDAELNVILEEYGVKNT